MTAPIIVAGRECRFVQNDHDDTRWAISDLRCRDTFLRDDGQWIEWMHAPPEVRSEMHRFHHPTEAAAREFALAARSQPRIVCLCGSGRFKDAFEQAEFDETLAGKIVLTIGCNTKDIARTPDLEHHKPMLDELHLRKIDLADEVFVLNVGGYIGQSTRREVEYAKSHGKPIRFLEPSHE